MLRLIARLALCFGISAVAGAQELSFPHEDLSDAAATDAAMPVLAKQIIASYHDENREKYLANLYAFQIVAGEYANSIATIKSLRGLQKANGTSYVEALYVPYESYSSAKLKQASGLAFADGFQESFRDVFGHLADVAAYRASAAFTFDVALARNDFQAAVDPQKNKNSISLEDAIALIQKYEPYLVYREISPLTQALQTEDNNRRYDVRDDVLIKTKGGATISAVVVRKKGVTTPQPVALTFTIYAAPENYSQALLSAAHGYAGVIVFTRGKALSLDEIAPYEHEAQDGYDIIDWISKQPWCNGQVGMFGGSYNGFTQWATAKRMHPALKTIVPYVAVIPGLGLPMENNVFLNANYGWAFYVTDNKYLDDKVYFDPKRWNSLNQNWYASGRPYREIDQVDGTPNKWLQRWLDHPSFDKYWQDLVPYLEDFAKINIPVLTITGYYDDGQISALQYLKDHYKYNPMANHYLLIGPYDHIGSQRSRKAPVLRGYAIDPVAQIDTPEITFEWLDYVMRKGKKPALLQDRINYEVMGANRWEHASSLEKASDQTLKLYLSDAKEGDHLLLAKEKPAAPHSLEQEVDLADRKTSTNNNYYPFPIIGQKPDFSTGYVFLSEPFDSPIEINGTFSGEIKAIINKKDMDIGVVLYQVMPDGELFHLSYFLGRASYARDMRVRHLLTPGAIESIPFDRTRMTSRRMERGSRLLVLLNVNKNSFAEVNYGTGKDVAAEDIHDAGEPLKIQWRTDSYVKIPVHQ